MEVWIIEDYNIKQWNKMHSINIGVLIRKESHVNPLAFCNDDIVLIRKYFPDVTFFNFKTESIDVLQLGKCLLHGCLPFHFTFLAEERAQLDTTLELSYPQEKLP
jgi:hypothetical protein